MCLSIQFNFQRLLRQFKDKYFVEDVKILLRVHDRSLKRLILLEKEFSFPAFLTALMALMGIFANGYKMVFHTYGSPEYAIPLICCLIFHVSHFLFLIIVASVTNEAAQEIGRFVHSLPFRFPAYPDLKAMCELQLNRRCGLTLWKIYTVDRSLVIASLGTLLTYGILIGTLGKDNK
ncbi:hypothetical protein AVEN_6371-1 [Araneus ventricosus]|uniref:Gustatory receptor n=1 Tax=Araneus ventricosus TaxID=182803 RepID=A0A4Y2R390_ARAVE|nr:hypothetical protein AVEN_6371-1 [Araneus ventricosus]